MIPKDPRPPPKKKGRGREESAKTGGKWRLKILKNVTRSHVSRERLGNKNRLRFILKLNVFYLSDLLRIRGSSFQYFYFLIHVRRVQPFRSVQSVSSVDVFFPVAKNKNKARFL